MSTLALIVEPGALTATLANLTGNLKILHASADILSVMASKKRVRIDSFMLFSTFRSSKFVDFSLKLGDLGSKVVS